MTTKTIRRTVKLDAETDKLLTEMASKYEGNISFAVRQMIRESARREQQSEQTERGETR